MRHIPTLLRRELSAYFLGPMAFLILLAFQVIAWLNFQELLQGMVNRPRIYSGVQDPLNHYIVGNIAFWMGLLVAVPALTMRLVSEERRAGTIETLLTVPVTEVEVVISKWLAGVVMYLVLLLPFAVYLPFLYVQAKFYFDPGPFIALSIGLTSVGMMYVAIGLFFSALTRNQIVAAIWTFVTIFLSLVLPNVAYNLMAARGVEWAESIRFLMVVSHLQSFALGQLDLRYLMLHLSVCAFVLYLTIKVVQWRRQG
jgi:ABC-2 type transport system permease protein